ncbi:hypothetical protein KIW84_035453 [Lathyrus oleraceus]|uniref:Uncharacterized protein n=1 Tax=Pisum sativum TaxID=3888 RepID=A0A9D4Y1T3_PEA|nr:hypothetical protein KIW84_035453 [Pisum sativum]
MRQFVVKGILRNRNDVFNSKDGNEDKIKLREPGRKKRELDSITHHLLLSPASSVWKILILHYFFFTLQRFCIGFHTPKLARAVTLLFSPTNSTMIHTLRNQGRSGVGKEKSENEEDNIPD